MALRRCAGPDELLDLAGDFLAEREAEHNLIFGILGGVRRGLPAGHGDAYLAAILDGDVVVGAAVRTSPYGPVLSELDDPGLADLVADDLRRVTGVLAGALGPKAAVERFARRWEELSGASAVLQMEQRIHAASAATPPTGVPGRPRRVHQNDHALVLEWLDAFSAEALPDGAPRFASRDWLDQRLADEDATLMLWEHDGTPVSLAVSGQATPNGLRVGPVYTPPEHRGRGFATAVTATVTADALASGRTFCFLFTDLANPTSNAIYRRIGYRPVCDVDQWAFTR